MGRSKKSRKAFGGALFVAIAASAASAQQTSNYQQPTPVVGTAQPSTANGTIVAYDIPKGMVGAVAAQLNYQYGRDPAFRANSEPGTGRLLVYANANVQRDINGRLNSLVQEIAKSNNGAIPTVQTQTYPLRHVSPAELEDALRRIGGPRVTVNTLAYGDIAQVQLNSDANTQNVLQIDRKAKQVTLQGTTSSIHSWLQVISAIDNGAATPDKPTRIVPLAPADPLLVESTVRLIRTSLKQNPQNSQDQTTEQSSVGPVQGRAGLDPQTTALLALSDSTEGGLFGDVQLEFVPELGLVVAKGNKKDVQRVLEVIEKIKLQSQGTKPDVDIYMLKHVDSQALEAIVRDLYNNVLAQRQGQVSITALVQPNALLLIGQTEANKALRELLDKLDQPLDPSSQLRVFHLIHASSEDAETTIREFFTETPGGNNQTQRVGLGTRVKVTSDRRTNSLIVQASPRDLSEVARLIQELDVDNTPAQNEIKVITLQNALAADLATIIQNALNGTGPLAQAGAGGQGGGGGGGGNANTGTTPVSASLSIVSKDGRSNSGILSGAVITANPSINALVVRAPAKSMPLITELIKQLDQSPSAQAQIKVFEIKNADATLLSNEIRQLFGLPAAGQAQGNQLGGAFGGLFGLQNFGNLTTGSENSLVQLQLTVDTRTNSIIASGSKSDLDVIEVLLMRLDEEGSQNRKTEVIWLRNSNANDLAIAIQNLVQQQRTAITQNQLNATIGGQVSSQIGVTEQIDREIIVVAEPTTNSLIINSSPRYAKQIREVIERLDRRPPLIMVQILLAEVTLGDTAEFGTEWGLQDALNFDRGSASRGTLSSPGFNVNTPPGNNILTGRPDNVAGQGLSTFGLGRTNTGLNYGGLVLSAASTSVNVLIRALQDANRLQILSRPQVMTIDNVEAFVQVGARVPRVRSVNQNTIGGNSVNTEDVDVGLLMRLQPRTNQDGMILMNVSVERSNVGPEETGIPVGFGPNGEVIRSPLINTTRAQTRVTAFDGQTVAFAGLITKNRTSRSRRIPFLADIPIAGALFRFDTESDTRTELLVVMTPHIVRTPEDMQTIVDVESSRMSWCLADVLNIHGDTNLSPGNGLWGPASSPIIYPDMQPTVDPTLQGQSLLIEGQPMQPIYDPNQPVYSTPPMGISPGATGTQSVEAAMPVQPISYGTPNMNQGYVAPASNVQIRR